VRLVRRVVFEREHESCFREVELSGDVEEYVVRERLSENDHSCWIARKRLVGESVDRVIRERGHAGSKLAA
jgi:hypothetical protein